MLSLPLARRVTDAVPIARFVVQRLRGRKLPLVVTFCVTNRCNLHCTYCDMPITRRDEMSTEEWCRAIDEFRGAGMLRASIMGGEPLVRRDIGAILAHLRSRGVHTTLNTNGWYLADHIDDVIGVEILRVGLDGPRAVHDAQRRREGSYDRAVAAIELAVSRGLRVVTMTPVTVDAFEQIDHVLRLARDMGFTASFQLEHDADCDTRGEIGAGVADDRVAAIARHLLERRAAGWPVRCSTPYLEQLMQRGRRMVANCTDCSVPRYSCMVRPDGMVVPCFLTQQQGPMRSGREDGFAASFLALGHPSDPGCSAQGLQEMNLIFRLRPKAVVHAALRL